jgi:outer membrane immunogenic protein
MGGLRSYLLATVSAAACSTGALAADLPARVPVKAPAPVVAPWSWAGFYVGINAGAAWNHAKFTDLGDQNGLGYGFLPGTTYWSPTSVGFTGGGQIGYNFQSGNLVYGLEADLNWVNAKKSETLTTAAAIVAVFSGPLQVSTKLEWMATVRGRLGITLSPTLLYVTGGWAIAGFEDQFDAPVNTDPVLISKKTRSGWTVGGGIEHMFARNWTAKIEALYADFGSWTASGPNVGGLIYRTRFEHEVITVRGGLNWKW